jgi:mono/diheme cytochrome c family protein
VERRAPASVPLLEKLITTSHSPQAIVHAIWTLHGMNSLKAETILAAIKSTQPRVVAQAIRAAGSFAGQPESAALLKEIVALANASDWETKLSVALVAGSFPEPEGLETARKLLADNPKDELIRTAVISSLGARPNEFVALMRENPGLAALGKKPTSANPTRKIAGDEKKRWDNGAKIYGNFCVGCHQPGGDGFVGIAPPLAKSEWIQGDPKILGTIILSGLQGPIKVNGKKYESPDIMPLMPGHLPVTELDDAALSDLMTYLRNTFNNNAEPVAADVAAAARETAKSHPAPFTPEELHPKK